MLPCRVFWVGQHGATASLSHEESPATDPWAEAWNRQAHHQPLTRPSTSYRTPSVLQPIELLDLLELGGTTAAAAAALGISQPSVSRRSRQLVLELGLAAQAPGLRFGQSRCLELLRRACQAHRLEAGAWRLGTTPWLEAVLQEHRIGSVVPGRFRKPSAWLDLVACHALDGALLSELDLQLLLPELPSVGSEGVVWQGCRLLPIARAPLGLLLPPACTEPPARWGPVAVPPQPMAPGLAALVRQQQWQCLPAPQTCHDPPAWGLWLQQQNLPTVATPAWAQRLRPYLTHWYWHPWPGTRHEQQWLLVLETIWQEHSALQMGLSELKAALAGDADSESSGPAIGGQRSKPPRNGG